MNMWIARKYMTYSTIWDLHEMHELQRCPVQTLSICLNRRRSLLNDCIFTAIYFQPPVVAALPATGMSYDVFAVLVFEKAPIQHMLNSIPKQKIEQNHCRTNRHQNSTESLPRRKVIWLWKIDECPMAFTFR